MALQVVHNSLDEIPEQYRDLYTEKDGKFYLTAIAGVKTQADIDRIQEGLRKEREDHQATKSKLREWQALGDREEVAKNLDRIPELEVAAKGSQEELDSKLEELTEARVKSRLLPVERKARDLEAQLTEAQETIGQFQGRERARTIRDKVDAAAQEAKIATESLDDARLLAENVFMVTDDGAVITKENRFGVTPGLTPDVFFTEMRDRRPRWWNESQGGGATGGGPGGTNGQANPFAKDTWNLTEQAKVYRDKGPEKAAQLAKLAGTTVGGARPS